MKTSMACRPPTVAKQPGPPCEDDFENHFDYIHFNPVKHGYVPHPAAWPWSSFHRWVKAGVYPANWGHVPTMPRLEKMTNTTGE